MEKMYRGQATNTKSISTLILHYCILPWICSFIAGKDKPLVSDTNKTKQRIINCVLYYSGYSPYEKS